MNGDVEGQRFEILALSCCKKSILRVMAVNLYLLHHFVDIRSVHSRPEELLIAIYRIKNKGLCLHNMCVLCIFIVYM